MTNQTNNDKHNSRQLSQDEMQDVQGGGVEREMKESGEKGGTEREPNEPGLAGVTIYADLNCNG